MATAAWWIAVLCLFLPPFSEDEPKTRPELTNFEATSRYDDVVQFIGELQRRSALLRVETFGETQEGRALPLMIIADPPVSQPRDAAASGKPVVFVFANIHAGEVEGKEAAQHIARRLLSGDLRSLLDRVVVLMAPIYNADGNEKISLANRTSQYGPIDGVGQRANAGGLDLNRDYMKMDAPETRALVGILNRWDPHVTVDLHTTNGSYHGYHLTYSIPLNPSVDARILSYHRDRLMPEITRAMLERHKFRTYYYGNFSSAAPKTGEEDKRTWLAFSPAPRIGQNYVGFRNRLTILSEAYSYLEFRRRIEVTEALLEEILRYSAARGDEILQVTRRADAETVRLGSTSGGFSIGVEYEPQALPKPVEILVGEVTKVRNPRSGREMTAMVEDRFTRVKMPDFGMFSAKRAVAAPVAYLLPKEAASAVERLRGHGIAVEELLNPLTAEVETFVVSEAGRAGRGGQGRQELRIKGEAEYKTLDFPVGTVVVRTAQPLGRLAAYLLEPESDDGLTSWGFFETLVAPGKTHPVCKLHKELKTPTRLR